MHFENEVPKGDYFRALKKLPLSEIREIPVHLLLQRLNGELDAEAALAWWLAVKFLNRRPERPHQLIMDHFINMRIDGTLHDPLRRRISDKYETKDYYREVIDPRHIIPTLGIFNSLEEARRHRFNKPIILKPTHGSGLFKILNENEARSFHWDEIGHWWSQDYYQTFGESNYFGLKKRVIVEPLVVNPDEMFDYRILCWNGEPKLWFVSGKREGNSIGLFYNLKWEQLDIPWGPPGFPWKLEKPKEFDQANHIATLLAKPFEFIRVDLFISDNTIFVGELTNLPGGGLSGFLDEESEYQTSKLIMN